MLHKFKASIRQQANKTNKGAAGQQTHTHTKAKEQSKRTRQNIHACVVVCLFSCLV
jgi:hypothetical protein